MDKYIRKIKIKRFFRNSWLGRFWYWMFPKKFISIKPTGTVSAMSGTTSGIHAPHSETYQRKIKKSS